MKKKLLIILSACLILIDIYSQRDMELSFTAIDNDTHIQLDSIKIMNRKHEGDTVLYWPDTVLVISIFSTDIQENDNERVELKLSQNYPNPVTDRTTINICIPEKDEVNLMITDALGKEVITSKRLLDEGCHEYSFTPGDASIYFFNANWRGTSQSIKIINAAQVKNRYCSLEYTGSKITEIQVKRTGASRKFFFYPGDQLLYIGYTNESESGIIDVPDVSKTYTFQFASNIPCPGTPTVTYEGQVYNTVQIFSQCWLKENLNVGTYIPGYDDQLDNGVIEKYCMNNTELSCDVYGGLYRWDEMMQYTTTQGAQGICPEGWHLFTVEEWKVLEGSVDSQYGIGDPEWDNDGSRGFDSGLNLRTTYGWYLDENGTDLVGFSALPGGAHHATNGFFMFLHRTDFWSSTDYNPDRAFEFAMSYMQDKTHTQPWLKATFGASVRCIKD